MDKHRNGERRARIAAAALLLALGAAPAWAQMPGGSYLETCMNVRGFGDRIIAECRRVDGNWTRTALHDVGSCVGDISNMNGHLTCNHGGQFYGNRARGFEGYGSSFDNERRYREYYGR